jgi:hypothetical protein
MFIKIWLHFMLHKKFNVVVKDFAFQRGVEKFESLFLQLICPNLSRVIYVVNVS